METPETAQNCNKNVTDTPSPKESTLKTPEEPKKQRVYQETVTLEDGNTGKKHDFVMHFVSEKDALVFRVLLVMIGAAAKKEADTLNKRIAVLMPKAVQQYTEVIQALQQEIADLKRLRKAESKKCLECGIEFLPTRKDQVFHEKKCRDRYYNRRAKEKRNALKNQSALEEPHVNQIEG
jgi:hypothetical protein